MRPTECIVSKAAFHNNFNHLRHLMPPHAQVLAVIKANAYGHGAVGMATFLREEGVSHFAVATVEEALSLRREGISDPIYLLGGPYGDYQACAEWNLIPIFSDVESLREWGVFLRTQGKTDLPCHLKFDTGMSRLGFLDADECLRDMQSFSEIRVEGVMTHLAVADEEDKDSQAYTIHQLRRFVAIAQKVKDRFPELTYIHCANSALMLRGEIPDSCTMLVRPGLSLYGVAPQAWLENRLSEPLQPILTWKTAIHSVKTVPAGSSVSYGRTCTTNRESRIAVLPVGYADGYSRRFSNRAHVLVRGRKAPVVGRVCMDLTMIDVTDIPDVCRGDEVILIGRQGSESIPVDQLAAWAETISYEIFCRISDRVGRRYV